MEQQIKTMFFIARAHAVKKKTLENNKLKSQTFRIISKFQLECHLEHTNFDVIREKKKELCFFRTVLELTTWKRS